jgi:hypothetical protein
MEQSYDWHLLSLLEYRVFHVLETGALTEKKTKKDVTGIPKCDALEQKAHLLEIEL